MLNVLVNGSFELAFSITAACFALRPDGISELCQCTNLVRNVDILDCKAAQLLLKLKCFTLCAFLKIQ